ncbi:MAG: YbaB/EbfC family nucleoid-associated protein [Propionibacteriaceae bacterium]|jgi:hypothetical protein|nr:YbaB/EbfC family nucleoid-associated protein [Propionibacteriaceae bacterium]
MTDWDSLAERLKADVAADLEQARERALSASRVRAEVEQVRGTVEDDGVRAEVDSTGRLLSLDLDDALGGKGLAQLVMAVVRDAHKQAAGKVADIAEREFGADSEFVERIRVEAESRIVPESDPEPEARPSPSATIAQPWILRPGSSR